MIRILSNLNERIFASRLFVQLGVAVILVAVLSAYASAQDAAVTGEPETTAVEKTNVAEAGSTVEKQNAPTEPSDGELPLNRAWEYSHYRVRVWLCTDGSPEINGSLHHLKEELISRAELLDRSGWEFLVDNAPNPWNWRFQTDIGSPDELKEFTDLPEISFDDKLMIIVLSRSEFGVRCRVREFDLWARQWGAMLDQDFVSMKSAPVAIFDMVKTAFMPVAQIDNANEKNEVAMRAKAVLSCTRVRFDENGEWIAEQNPVSPAYIRTNDVFLPVLRRTDRDGNLTSLDPVAYTFVTIDEINGARVNGHVQSTVRAPLSARKTKRLQKIALVIRPPEGITTLQVVSDDEKSEEMEGIEIWSRRPNAPKEEASEFLGKTDWRGQLEITPSPEGMRMIFLKRGNRALRKLPIVPGFIKLQTADITNDEARLFAEGVIQGVHLELLDLIAQRQVYEKDCEDAIDAGDYVRARLALDKYDRLPQPQQFRSRLSNEKLRLLSRAKNQREAEFIDNMFNTLLGILGTFIGESKATEMRAHIQRATGVLEVNSDGSGDAGSQDSTSTSVPEAATEPATSTETGPEEVVPPASDLLDQ
ncbi:MAG: hypothetical protein R3C03_10310 [Pirellulaceae bacterium]